MNLTLLLLLLPAAIAVLLVAAIIWLSMLPGEAAAMNADPISLPETEALVDGLRPPRRPRPLIAIVGINEGTEATDYLIPLGILRRSRAADVIALSTRRGPLRLAPALTIEAEATIDDFDAQHGGGADYVIVPAMRRDKDPQLTAWIRVQYAKGATIIGLCAGAKVVAEAGLLKERRATTHWYYVRALLKKDRSITYVPNRRFLVDRRVATTTGISASIPMMLTLIEAIAGEHDAKAIARELGVEDWDARHDSCAFKFTRAFALTVVRNLLAFWKRETLALELHAGIDEACLSIVADAWSRTYRSNVFTFSSAGEPTEGRSGIRIIPDRTAKRREVGTLSLDSDRPADVLNATLEAIAARYGKATARIVAAQFEYGWTP